MPDPDFPANEPWMQYPPPAMVTTPDQIHRWYLSCRVAWNAIAADYPERVRQLAFEFYSSDIPTD